MQFTVTRVWLLALLLALAGVGLAVVKTVQAQCLVASQSDICSDSTNYLLSGSTGSISGQTSNPNVENPSIGQPILSTAGALIYADYVALEVHARTLLDKAVRMRESISPYQDNNDFENHLRQLDFRAGWENQPFGGSKPGYESASTFAQLVEQMEKDLTEARNLYAFLTVFGPTERFRQDGRYINAADSTTEALCGTTDKEDPNPQAAPGEPTVLPPVIDWCNFRARLQQSVREAANVRMIVGQEFMVDALGVNFSGGFIGGDDIVKNELAQLRAARYQFEQAEQWLSKGLTIAVGNGCLISDFYTQNEWSLLTRAVTRQETAQYHIATREVYLNINGPQSNAQAKADAQITLRQSANDAHIKLIGMAGLGAPVAKPQCAIGERPDQDLVAQIALNQIETKRKAQAIAAGLNIFGFDVSMTPARAYISSSPFNCDTSAAGNRGLWDEAWCSAELAKGLQEREEQKKRAFDVSQEKLNESLNAIRQGLDTDIYNASGCDSNGVSDQAFFACTQRQIDVMEECLRLAGVDAAVDATTLTPPSNYANFEACMDPVLNINERNDLYTALRELRADYLAFQAIEQSATNINERIQNSNDANATVTKWLGLSGAAETAARVSQAVLDGYACIGGAFTQALSAGQQGAGCVILGGINIAAQATAGALSTQADIEVANAENTKEIKDLLLQMSELLIDAQSARQAFLAKRSDVGGNIDLLQRNLAETQRQRAYFATSPANDPSFRIVHDAALLDLAAALERAARISYLAARRAEYEYAARLAQSHFAISDIYRARTAQDIEAFLKALQLITDDLSGSASQATNTLDLKISVAQDVLLLTDDLLRSEGFSTPEAIGAERIRRFRTWVAEKTVPNDFTAPKDGKPVLRFSFPTSLLDGGLFANVISQGYANHWLLKLSGIGTPKESSNGVSINLVSDEINLSYRKAVMTQGGTVHMRAFNGCLFDYRLIAPAQMLGREWPKNQNGQVVSAVLNANVNDSHAYTENGYRTSAFVGQAVSATEWEITVFAGTPQTSLGLPDMDLQQLTDIELNLSITYASRTDFNNDPVTPADCARIDY